VLAADLVQGLGGELDDVVVVDGDDRLRRVLSDRLGVALAHVHRDRGELGGALADRMLGVCFGGLLGLGQGGWGVLTMLGVVIGAVELGEELIGGGLALALGAPHHAAASVIADKREVAVALSPRDLVDRDLK